MNEGRRTVKRRGVERGVVLFVSARVTESGPKEGDAVQPPRYRQREVERSRRQLGALSSLAPTVILQTDTCTCLAAALQLLLMAAPFSAPLPGLNWRPSSSCEASVPARPLRRVEFLAAIRRAQLELTR
jgi:hypothetical protein